MPSSARSETAKYPSAHYTLNHQEKNAFPYIMGLEGPFCDDAIFARLVGRLKSLTVPRDAAAVSGGSA